jgi:hypothetical protein
MMLPRILRGQSKQIDKSYKFSQNTETSGHRFNIYNHNSHQICYLSNKLPTSAIMKIDQSNPLNMYLNYPHMSL